MKVLHVIPSVGPLRGGPSVVVRTMARGLAQVGLEVHVAATDDNGPGRLAVPHHAPVVDDGVTYRYFPRQTRFYTVSWPLHRWLARHVGDYDVVHIHALFSFASVAAAYWAARAGVPYVVRPLGTLDRWGIEHRRRWLKRLSFFLMERRVLQNAARIHYASEQEQIEAEQLGEHGPAAVVPLGIDLANFASLPARGALRERQPGWAGQAVALFLSRLDRKKGLDLVLTGLAQARARGADVALAVVGNGDPAFERAIRRDAVRLGIEAHVLWAGFLTGRERLAAFADADLFVLPSYSENFGVAAVEAMAAGLPVVVSDRVGIHREIAEAQAGLVVPCDSAAVANSILELASDARLRAELGARGRRLARDRFSLETMTSGLVAMYEQASGIAAWSPRADGTVASSAAERA